MKMKYSIVALIIGLAFCINGCVSKTIKTAESEKSEQYISFKILEATNQNDFIIEDSQMIFIKTNVKDTVSENGQRFIVKNNYIYTKTISGFQNRVKIVDEISLDSHSILRISPDKTTILVVNNSAESFLLNLKTGRKAGKSFGLKTSLYTHYPVVEFTGNGKLIVQSNHDLLRMFDVKPDGTIDLQSKTEYQGLWFSTTTSNDLLISRFDIAENTTGRPIETIINGRSGQVGSGQGATDGNLVIYNKELAGHAVVDLGYNRNFKLNGVKSPRFVLKQKNQPQLYVVISEEEENVIGFYSSTRNRMIGSRLEWPYPIKNIKMSSDEMNLGTLDENGNLVVWNLNQFLLDAIKKENL
ncbi:MAG: hypothetical protein J0L62_03050 [Bacteroidetes bacterium]|nr:hypothetical protein [Bacteroidota bacterium]